MSGVRTRRSLPNPPSGEPAAASSVQTPQSGRRSTRRNKQNNGSSAEAEASPRAAVASSPPVVSVVTKSEPSAPLSPAASSAPKASHSTKAEMVETDIIKPKLLSEPSRTPSPHSVGADSSLLSPSAIREVDVRQLFDNYYGEHPPNLSEAFRDIDFSDTDATPRARRQNSSAARDRYMTAGKSPTKDAKGSRKRGRPRKDQSVAGNGKRSRQPNQFSASTLLSQVLSELKQAEEDGNFPVDPDAVPLPPDLIISEGLVTSIVPEKKPKAKGRPPKKRKKGRASKDPLDSPLSSPSSSPRAPLAVGSASVDSLELLGLSESRNSGTGSNSEQKSSASRSPSIEGSSGRPHLPHLLEVDSPESSTVGSPVNHGPHVAHFENYPHRESRVGSRFQATQLCPDVLTPEQRIAYEASHPDLSELIPTAQVPLIPSFPPRPRRQSSRIASQLPSTLKGRRIGTRPRTKSKKVVSDSSDSDVDSEVEPSRGKAEAVSPVLSSKRSRVKRPARVANPSDTLIAERLKKLAKPPELEPVKKKAKKGSTESSVDEASMRKRGRPAGSKNKKANPDVIRRKIQSVAAQFAGRPPAYPGPAGGLAYNPYYPSAYPPHQYPYYMWGPPQPRPGSHMPPPYPVGVPLVPPPTHQAFPPAVPSSDRRRGHNWRFGESPSLSMGQPLPGYPYPPPSAYPPSPYMPHYPPPMHPSAPASPARSMPPPAAPNGYAPPPPPPPSHGSHAAHGSSSNPVYYNVCTDPNCTQSGITTSTVSVPVRGRAMPAGTVSAMRSSDSNFIPQYSPPRGSTYSASDPSSSPPPHPPRPGSDFVMFLPPKSKQSQSISRSSSPLPPNGSDTMSAPAASSPSPPHSEVGPSSPSPSPPPLQTTVVNPRPVGSAVFHGSRFPELKSVPTMPPFRNLGAAGVYPPYPKGSLGHSQTPPPSSPTQNPSPPEQQQGSTS